MKPEPLELIDIYVDVDTEPHTIKCKGATKEQIKSAIEWYKLSIIEFYKFVEGNKCSREFLKTYNEFKYGKSLQRFEIWLLNKAFQDVMEK